MTLFNTVHSACATSTARFAPPHERWKPVKGYEGLYAVSNLGRIRGRKGRALRTRSSAGFIGLYRPEKGRTFVAIARLVLEAFCEGSPAAIRCGAKPLHLDGDPTNNRLANLVWAPRTAKGRRMAREFLAE